MILEIKFSRKIKTSTKSEFIDVLPTGNEFLLAFIILYNPSNSATRLPKNIIEIGAFVTFFIAPNNFLELEIELLDTKMIKIK